MPAKVSENIRPMVMAEAGRGGEEVRRADVRADRRGRRLTAPGPGQGEDHHDQAQGGDHFGQEVRGGGAVLGGDADRRLGEHQVRRHRPGDAPRDLHGQVSGGGTPAQPAEKGVGEGHHRIEMRA
jgi:hypothetical protein